MRSACRRGVPIWSCMADIAEEVGRLFGYNNIPTTTFRGAATEGGYTEAHEAREPRRFPVPQPSATARS